MGIKSKNITELKMLNCAFKLNTNRKSNQHSINHRQASVMPQFPTTLAKHELTGTNRSQESKKFNDNLHTSKLIDTAKSFRQQDKNAKRVSNIRNKLLTLVVDDHFSSTKEESMRDIKNQRFAYSVTESAND